MKVSWVNAKEVYVYRIINKRQLTEGNQERNNKGTREKN